MRETIIAMNSKYLLKRIKDKNDGKIVYKNLQYREAILETLENNKNIRDIIIDEKIPGEINMEKLIKKILIIDDRINIIFFLEKEDDKKVDKLKKLGIEKIYINNKNNIDKIVNNLFKEKNKLVTIEGTPKSGKTTVTNLLIKDLINRNKKILLINLNKHTEDMYLSISKINKNKGGRNVNRFDLKDKKQFINNLKNSEIRINENVTFIDGFQKLIDRDTKDKLEEFLENYSFIYDYIIVDIGNKNIKYVKNQIIKNSVKNIIIINSKKIEIKQLKELEEEKNKENIHVVCNQYNLLSISNSIIKNIIGKKFLCSKIFYNKNYQNITKEFYKEDSLIRNVLNKRQIEKILQHS